MDHVENNLKAYISLQPHQEELIQLSELAGIHANPTIFHIIIELLNMEVEPEAIFDLLKKIRKSYKASKASAIRSLKQPTL